MLKFFYYLTLLTTKSSISEACKSRSGMNRYDITKEFASLMLDCEHGNESQLDLFNLLHDLYRTGQLLIPQVLFDTVREIEKQVCLNKYKVEENDKNEQYTVSVNEFLCSSIFNFLKL